MPVKLGELLLKENMVTPQQLQEALNHQKMGGGKLGKAFVSLGFVKDEEITSLLSRQYGVPSINLDHFEVDPAIIKIIPAETARKYQVLPLSRSGATLTIAMADPTNVFALDDVKFMTGYSVEPVVASESALEDAIERYYDPARRNRQRQAAIAGALDALQSARPILTLDDLAAIGGLVEEVLRRTVLELGWPASTAGSGAATQEAQALRPPEVLVGDGAPGLLAAQLAEAHAEIAELRQRLLQLSSSDILAVQLANAKAEIEALRERLFEHHAYRTAYESLLRARPSPRTGTPDLTPLRRRRPAPPSPAPASSSR